MPCVPSPAVVSVPPPAPIDFASGLEVASLFGSFSSSNDDETCSLLLSDDDNEDRLADDLDD